MLRVSILGLRVALFAAVAAAAGTQIAPALSVDAAVAQTAGTPLRAGATARPDVPRDALLLVLDSFDVVRTLDDAQFQIQRDEVARNLLENLIPFLVASPTGSQPSQPVVPPAPTPAAQPEVKPVPAAPPAPTRPTQVKPSAGGSPKPVVEMPAGHADDPAYSRVPQKTRIRTKFRSAAAPFKALQASDPEKARMVDELLRAARSALAKEQFDTAESYIDHALDMLNVEGK